VIFMHHTLTCLDCLLVENGTGEDDEEERTQERLAKRFAKRARMQRLVEEHKDSQEFSQQRLIDEDESMKLELSQMKVSEAVLTDV
jgi:hypothetical protein